MSQNPIDAVIAEHARRLQKIYDEQIAGDHTFTGALYNFLIDIKPVKDYL